MSYVDFYEEAARNSDEAASERPSEALSVSAAMALAKNSLEAVTVTIVGEISEVSVKAGYKAAYFTVKDQSAALPCMMWNNRYRAAGLQLQVGQLVQLTGRFTLYAAKGRMNFDVFALSLAGEGNLRQRVAQLANKLKSEGLMDASRKLPIPQTPRTIGLVTSPRGAAVHDVLRTLRRRYPLARVLLAGVPVEGQSAPRELSEALATVCDAGAEVVLLVRGGGSFEDLMPFNDEGLARSIAALPVPVVTGIGHEPDTSIADMVADLRASTPTAAAEAVAPDIRELRASAASSAMALGRAMSNVLSRCSMHIDRCATRPVFQDPLLLFAAEAQSLDYAEERLARALPAAIQRQRDACDTLNNRLRLSASQVTEPHKAHIALCASRLHDLSPLATIGRGYAMVQDGQGGLVRSVSSLDVGQRVHVTLADGVFESDVASIRKEENN